MADWLNNPNLTQTYSAFVSSIRARDEDSAKMFNGTGTNPPDESIRWNSGAEIFQIYSSATTSWSTISPGIPNLVVASAPNSRTLIQVDVYTATGTWTKPEGCSAAEIWVIAGGGGGGGAITVSGVSGRCALGGGGGGSGVTYVFKTAGLNATASVHIGSGGAGASTQSTGVQGGQSWFQQSNFVRAEPGNGGFTARSSAVRPISFGGGGSGGNSNGTGDLNLTGGDGSSGIYIEFVTTSGGSMGSGEGGDIPLFGGVRKSVSNSIIQYYTQVTGGNGVDSGLFGCGYGSGGNGASNYRGSESGSTTYKGGKGANGLCIVKSYT